MGTVTGAYQINFAPLANTNPYSNSDFLALDDPASTEGAPRIDGGLLRSQDAFTIFAWRLNPAVYVPGTTIRAKIEAGFTGGSRDGVGVALLDASGNGYILRAGTSVWSRFRVDAWTPHFDSAWDEPFTGADGDEAEIEYNKSTGALRIFRNGVQVVAMDTTDTTYAANALAPVAMHSPGDTGNGGIRSFAADGVSGGAAAITGTGALTAAVATIATTANRGRINTNSPALTAAVATLAGTAHTGRFNTNSPALSTGTPTVAGSGTIGVHEPENYTGSGALTAAIETVAGIGTRGVLDQPGDIAVQSVPPTVAGTGTVAPPGGGTSIIGNGSLTASVQTLAGAATRGHPGTGAMTAAVPTVVGTQTPIAITGSGALNAQTPLVAGTDVVGSIGNGGGTRQFGLGLGLGL